MADMKRPWQGTGLAVLDIIGVVFTFLAGLAFMFLQSFIQGLFQTNLADQVGEKMAKEVGSQYAAELGAVTSAFAGMGMVMGLVMIGVGVLLIFMARGALKGQKWSPVLSIIFGALGLLGGLSALSNPLTVGNPWVNILVSAFMLYCAVMCVQNPFYNQKKA